MGDIVTSEAFYKKCINEDWAVGGFIGYDMEIMQASARAAYKVKAPIMLQASCRVIDYSGAKMLRKMAEAISDELDTDLVLHLDHGDSIERCVQCIDNGFTSVMLDNEFDSFEENARKTKIVCDYAHQHGAVVEGEVFHPTGTTDKYWTDVEEAVEYVRITGCDSLAVCCGNAHDLPAEFEKKLHIEQIRKIHEALPNTPLVLHATAIVAPEFVDRANRVGGCLKKPCNFTREELQETFKFGVCKINSALEIKILYTTAIREYMLMNPTQLDPRKYLGYARDTIEDFIANKHVSLFLDSGRM